MAEFHSLKSVNNREVFLISWRLEARDETVADVMSLEDLVTPGHTHWFSFTRDNAGPFRDGSERAPPLHTVTR